MASALEGQERAQSPGEEVANSVSHGLGLLAAIAALPVLVVAAARDGSATTIIGASIFGATMVLLYLTSTLYHALPAGRPKQVLQVLDHGAIYLLIAGTYTPFTLGALSGPWGWTLFGLVWGFAAIGLVVKSIGGAGYGWFSNAVYLGMGWLALIVIKPLWESVPGWGIFWLVAGGLSYTLGIVFFVLDERVRYTHFVWHLFVLAGTACHFVAVLNYAA
ncbi:MAG: PAQR family membrane homeostasis protein TrhA [Planctomycetota bacterium]|jgi:hemolysin III